MHSSNDLPCLAAFAPSNSGQPVPMEAECASTTAMLIPETWALAASADAMVPENFAETCTERMSLKPFLANPSYISLKSPGVGWEVVGVSFEVARRL